jgi:hypothetical protein
MVDRLPDLQIRRVLVSMEEAVRKSEATIEKHATGCPFDYYVALTALVAMPGAPGYVSPEVWESARQAGSYSEIPLLTNGIEDVFTTLLINAKSDALRVFTNLVNFDSSGAGFSPESKRPAAQSETKANRVLMIDHGVVWSNCPGFF